MRVALFAASLLLAGLLASATREIRLLLQILRGDSA